MIYSEALGCSLERILRVKTKRFSMATLAATLSVTLLPVPTFAAATIVAQPVAARSVNMPPPPWCPGGGTLVGPSSAPAKTRAVAHMAGMRALQLSQSSAAGTSRFVSFCSPKGVSIISVRTQYLAYDGKYHVVLTLSNPKSPALQEIIVMQDARAVTGIPLPRNTRVSASYRPPR
jgi:hypothetical protein